MSFAAARSFMRGSISTSRSTLSCEAICRLAGAVDAVVVDHEGLVRNPFGRERSLQLLDRAFQARFLVVGRDDDREQEPMLVRLHGLILPHPDAGAFQGRGKP